MVKFFTNDLNCAQLYLTVNILSYITEPINDIQLAALLSLLYTHLSASLLACSALSSSRELE